MWIDIIWIGAAYLLGSLSSAIIVCRVLGLPDPRAQGSGNPGATNVLRLGGKKAAAITLAGDFLKGYLPVLAATLTELPPTTVAAVALAAFLGHLYPLFFQFRGGKGVATAFGAILGLSPWSALAALAVWLIIAKLFRVSSLAALAAAATTPPLLWLTESPAPYLAVSLPIVALLMWRHRGNIARLIGGQESRF